MRLDILKLGRAAGTGVFAAAVATSVVASVLPIAFVVWSGVLIGRVPAAVREGWESAAGTDLRVAIALTGALFVAHEVVAPFQAVFADAVGRRVDARIRDRLARAATTAEMEVLEDQALLDRLTQVRQPYEWTWSTPGDAAGGMLVTFGRYVAAVAGAVIVAALWSVPAAVALLATTLYMRYGQHRSLREEMNARRDTTPLLRRGEYFSSLGTDRSAGKEIRLFGLVPWIVQHFEAAQLARFRINWAARRSALGTTYAVIASISIGVCIAVAVLLARAAVAGNLSLASFLICLFAAGVVLRASAQAREDDATRWGYSAFEALVGLESEVTTRAPASGQRGVQIARKAPREAIRFERVSFSYPGSGRRVIDDLDLELPAGTSLAVVGLNGAGKTTLVKLLARLYQPTGGRIAVDGTDLALIDQDDWRRRLAVISQDFIRYELSLADNIAFGAIHLAHDRAAIERAARRAQLDDVLAHLPRGLDTILSRQYEHGAELSGGQWQRTAIARALIAVEAGASLVILDEPTANLDVRSELSFYEEFLALTRGLTSIVISHRFSTVRHADTIVVLEGGRIVESGTHDELLQANGRYAILFRTQAARFEDEPE